MKTISEIKAELKDLRLMLRIMKKEQACDIDILDIRSRIVTLEWVLGLTSDVLN